MTMDFNQARRNFALGAAASVIALALLAGCTSESPDVSTTSSVITQTSAEGTTSDIQTQTNDSVPAAFGTATSGVTNPESVYGSTSAAPSSDETFATPATTEVPAPGGGNINETVAASELTTNPPVAINESAEIAGGVVISLSKVEMITAEAKVPGEISGPGIAISVDVANNSSEPIDLSNVVVNFQDAAGNPGNPMIGEPASPIRTVLAAGETASGVYVFALPDGYASPATISFSYSVSAPVVLFVGDTQ